MSPAPVSVTRAQRLRTAIALTAAAAAVTATAWLSPRARRAAPIGPSSPYLSARVDSSHIMRGTSETYLAVSMVAPDGRTSTQRPSTSLAIVLDRSGSMLGEPIEDARRAAIALIDKLGPDDELTVITYSTGVERVLPLALATPQAKAYARAAIAELIADGGTNISGGLSAAADELTRAHHPLRRMVLISDGQANEGIYDRAGLVELARRRAADGLSITAVGVGLDFNEETMAGIAVAGRGNYHFVENTADLGAMFLAELGSLGETVLTHAALQVTPADGVEILDVIGYDMTVDGRVATVPVADLRRGERTKVVFRVRVTTGDVSVKELATVSWSFSQLDTGTRVETAVARAEVTEDTTVVARGRDKDTVLMIEKAKTAVALDRAAAAYASGDERQAQTILHVRAAEAGLLADDLGEDAVLEEIETVTTRASAGFAAAPGAAAPEGKKAVKGGRADAYQLAR